MRRPFSGAYPSHYANERNKRARARRTPWGGAGARPYTGSGSVRRRRSKLCGVFFRPAPSLETAYHKRPGLRARPRPMIGAIEGSSFVRVAHCLRAAQDPARDLAGIAGKLASLRRRGEGMALRSQLHRPKARARERIRSGGGCCGGQAEGTAKRKR